MYDGKVGRKLSELPSVNARSSKLASLVKISASFRRVRHILVASKPATHLSVETCFMQACHETS